MSNVNESSGSSQRCVTPAGTVTPLLRMDLAAAAKAVEWEAPVSAPRSGLRRVRADVAMDVAAGAFAALTRCSLAPTIADATGAVIRGALDFVTVVRTASGESTVGSARACSTARRRG